MAYTRYIGRLSALAVALGVGMSVAGAAGIAAAQPVDSGSSGVDSSGSDPSSTPTTSGTEKPDADLDAVDASGPVDPPRRPALSRHHILSDLRVALRNNADRGRATPGTAVDEPEVDDHGRSHAMPALRIFRQAMAPPRASSPRPDAAVDVQPQRFSTHTPGPDTAAVTQPPAVRAPLDALRVPDAPPVGRRVVTSLVAAVLGPSAGSGPTAPASPSPLMWAWAAVLRRESERWPRVLGRQSSQATAQQTAEIEAPEVRTLILTAFPAEADAVLSRTVLDPDPVVVVDGHHFYLGTLGGKKVIVAMTGIGMVNATSTTETALSHFTSGSGTEIGAVVFSGVAGGADDTRIADVAVPARWTLDDGATWHEVDAGMLAVAQALTVDLASVRTLGNPLCASCFRIPAIPLVDLKREPQLVAGGDGSSSDGNNGQAFPCIPFGGDIFGCQACGAPDRFPFYTGNFFKAVVPFMIHGLLSNLQLQTAENPAFDAVDQETAAAQAVADAHSVPFLGIRGMSDGPGDPLHLPGFPFQFAFYRQLAAENAATVAEAFMQTWPGPA